MAGVEWLVPEEVEYHFWPSGKKLLVEPAVPPPGSAHTPVPVEAGDRGAVAGHGLVLLATPPVMCVPGP
jgi:hypothetical protein